MFGREELESLMDTEWAGHPVHFYEELGSTNVQAKLEAESGAEEGTLVVADMQTAGRGRRGRSWSSPAGVNVYFTLVLRPGYSPDKASRVTLLMALAVAEGISASCGVKAGIKWPNDVVVNGRKVCGILTEMGMEHTAVSYVVIGAGVNVLRQGFPPEIAATATSLQAECGREISRASLVAEIIKSFEKYYAGFRREAALSGMREQYDSLLVNRNREVRVLDPKGEFEGVARGINESGELLVERKDGSISKVYAGEVSVRGIYGYIV